MDKLKIGSYYTFEEVTRYGFPRSFIIIDKVNEDDYMVRFMDDTKDQSYTFWFGDDIINNAKELTKEEAKRMAIKIKLKEEH